MTNEQIIKLLREKRAKQEPLTTLEKGTIDETLKRVFVELERQSLGIEFEKGISKMVTSEFNSNTFDAYKIPIFPMWKREAVREYLKENGFEVHNGPCSELIVKLIEEGRF